MTDTLSPEVVEAMAAAIARYMEQDTGPKTYQGLAVYVATAALPLLEAEIRGRAHGN